MAETQTWRVVLASGEVREVATPQGTRGDATRVAIARNCALWHWPVAEILAPGELTRAELRAQVEAYAAQLAPMARVVDVLRAAAVAAGHPAADGDPDAQLRAVRAQAFREGAETMRGAVVQDPHMILSDYDEARIRALPVPPCPEVSR